MNIAETTRIVNANQKTYKNISYNQCHRAFMMIEAGYTFKDIQKAIPSISIWVYNQIFADLIQQRKLDSEVEIEVKYHKQPYWTSEDEMIVQPYNVGELWGAELEILNSLI